MPVLTGYSDEWSVEAGQSLRFMVSTDSQAFDAELLRLRHGDDHPDGPGFRTESLNHRATGRYPGRWQPTYPGSYIRVDLPTGFPRLHEVSLTAWVMPTLPVGRERQTIVSHRDDEGRGFTLAIRHHLILEAEISDGSNTTTTTLARVLRQDGWTMVALICGGGRLILYAFPEGGRSHRSEVHCGTVVPADGAPLIIGAGRLILDDTGRGQPSDLFNGRVERPRLYDRALKEAEIERLTTEGIAPAGPVADWDFAQVPSSIRVIDRGRFDAHGNCVNLPARAVAGHHRPTKVLDATAHPEYFGAIHFHEDDLSDAGWAADLAVTVPLDWQSGVYALHICADNTEDYIPFIVRPSPSVDNQDMLLLLPSLTYMAYANERSLASLNVVNAARIGRLAQPSKLDHLVLKHPEWGPSQYDLHSDGSPVYYASRHRPIPNLRPGYRHWMLGAPRGLSADLYLVDWLEEHDYSWAVATDEDLHISGQALLDSYRVVMTGTHPEYWTDAMLDALEAYLADGGSLMYMGGNGFYAVGSLHAELTHVSEVRRNVSGTRPWEPPPWEARHSTTGEPGGIWRHRGRSPNALTGVGFAAQGWDEVSSGYYRQPDSYEERVAFIFEGIANDEVIGAFGRVMNGAAGDELDRVDHALGSPPHVLRLASSSHSRYYLQATEDIQDTSPFVDGESNPAVRADLAFFETGAGGAVFSVGSMSWAGALSHDDYDNNVSRITRNVLDRFLAGPFDAPKVGQFKPNGDE